MKEQVASAAIVIALVLKGRRNQRRGKRTKWMKEWLKQRPVLGTYDTLLKELHHTEETDFITYMRMSPKNLMTFFLLLSWMLPNKTNMRQAIPAKVKLATTLRFLSTGSSYTDLQYHYRIHNSTLSKFVPEICAKMYEKLKAEYMQV